MKNTARNNSELRSLVSKRIGAKMIDLFLVVVVTTLIIYPIGPLVGFAYSIFGDGIPFGKLKGQSIGKKILGLRVFHIVTGYPAGMKDSLVRNTPVGVATFFAIIPFWGWIILILVGLPLLAIEIYLMMSADRAHRLGDVMGDTEVRIA